MELSIDTENWRIENWRKQDNNDDFNAQKIQTDEIEIWAYFTKSSQNDVAAIAAVDYAIKKRKPTCGFAMEFKMAFKV